MAVTGIAIGRLDGRARHSMPDARQRCERLRSPSVVMAR